MRRSADHATTSVLVPTSWLARASEQFAKRNRITLINGGEFKQLIKEHLNKDVTLTLLRRTDSAPLTTSGQFGPVQMI
jgi:restriction system protein